MNKKINKWVKVTLVAAACLPLGACSDFLNVDPLTIVFEDNYWKEKNDVDQVVTSCYVRMQSDDFLRRLFIWGESRSDNVRDGYKANFDYSNSAEGKILDEDLLATNVYTDWLCFYDVINRCNLVIEKAPKVAELDPAYLESDMNATIAEVKALRALCYFYLVRTFKDVPFYTYAYVNDEQPTALFVTDGDVIVRTLLDDLKGCYTHALKAWPAVNNEDVSYGRITQDAILSLMADMSLWIGNFEDAASYAGQVITNKYNKFYEKYGLAAMVSVDNKDYYPLFPDFDPQKGFPAGTASQMLFGQGGSIESIFELDFSSSYKTDGTAANEMFSEFFYRGVFQAYSGHDAGPGIFAPAKELWEEIQDNELFLSNTDSRIVSSMWYSDASDPEQAIVTIAKYAYMGFTLPISSTALTAAIWMERSVDDANWIFYRVSDVMLMRAEALIWQISDSEVPTEQDNKLADEAFKLIKAVANRSSRNSISALTKDDFSNKNDWLNLVYDERRRELLFEGKRWFDLVRRSRLEGDTKYLLEKVSSKFEGGQAVSATSRMVNLNGVYWPYSQDELKKNPNIKQNPAYPSAEDNSYESTK